jgi:biopolymer transport protein ExbD
VLDLKLPEEEAEEVNMAPLVDMVFLLLIFFMVASHLNQLDKVEIDVPVASHAKVPDELRDRRTITIKADGSIYLGTLPKTLQDVGPTVRRECRAVPNLKVYIRADKRLRHKKVKEVMKACAAAGAGEILFAAYEEE